MGELKQVDVPEGSSGAWQVSRFTLSREQSDVERIRAIVSGGRGVPEGTYTRLTRHGHVVMSDTPDEMRDHREPVRHARGHILINGLGLGMVLQACLDKPEVEHATVIDASADVIALVAPHYQARYGDRLTIIHADAFTWQPPKNTHYAMVWHDIWDDLCTDNLPEMARLKRKYGRRADWQDCWGEGITRAHARRERREWR